MQGIPPDVLAAHYGDQGFQGQWWIYALSLQREGLYRFSGSVVDLCPAQNCQDEEIYAWFCSPLIAILQALITASGGDSSKNVVNDNLSYMLNVFRAIRKAEDAIDARKTPKLHSLADIGMLLVKLLSPNEMPTYLPGRVLLPSSFYKVSGDTRSDEETRSFLTQCSFDENFTEKILHFYQSNIAGASTSSIIPNQSRKIQEGSRKQDVSKHSGGNVSLRKEGDKHSGKIKIEKEKSSESKRSTRQGSTREKNRRVVAASDDDGSVEIIQPKKGLKSVNGSVKSSLGTSVISSFESQARVKAIPSGREKDRKGSKKTPVSEPCTSKEPDEKLIGQRIKLWSPIDKCFYSGSIDGFDSQNSSHKVSYDNGEVELLRLVNEKWEIESDICSSTQDAKNTQSTISDSLDDIPLSSLLGVETRGSKATKKRKEVSVDNVKAPLVKDGKKRKELVLVDSADSDIVDVPIVRMTRSRSRKV